MSATLYGDKPRSGQRIDEVHCWIAIQADGSEGIMSADMPMPFGNRHATLMSSKRHLAERLEPIVRVIKDKAHSEGQLIEVELRTYRRVT